MSSNTILRGILFGALTGAAWGLVFLAPELTRDFSPWQLAAGRYLAYGLFAAVLIAPRLRALLPHLGLAEWRALVWLSLLGNVVYYVFLASAVQMGGMAMTSLVIGFLPVAVTIIGSRGKGAVPIAKLAPSLALGLAGIACVAWQSLGGAQASAAGSQQVIGFFCALGALVSWTTYAVGNSRWLARLHAISAHDWSLLTGLVTGLLSLFIAVPAFTILLEPRSGAQWTSFIGVCAGVAIFASIFGNACWNKASRLLPLTMIGQMILFETLFALLYGFLWERRLPTLLETAAMVLVTASVMLCVSAHRVVDEGGGH
ncbi:DMT family transporter [Herbaspirillum robiniae]|uniref:DMT family transporter n=1 Tax=Herbaspirillum robiniae TaxID=2014887 RepID=A0A246WNK8_9BURK|nr:DMT family transporter [Herbaspirillum robiniae]NUU02782.1 DMT family transporter [Herbaspirillum robiniae]OWY27106.1 EamA family transporter [Herbaspirillum robiniae]